MITAVFFYEVFLADTKRVVNAESVEHIRLVTNTLEPTDLKHRGGMGVDTPNSKGSRDDGSSLDMFSLARRRDSKGDV